MQGDPARERVEVRPVETGEVPLDTERVEKRGGRPVAQAVRAPRGVRNRTADVRPHQLWRHQERRPALDVLAFERVDGVAGPDPIGALEDARIHSRATRRARLDLQRGMCGTECVEETVGRKGLAVGGRCAGVGGVGEVPVVVPLEVGDVVLVEQREQGVAEPDVGAIVLQVEHLLVAPLRRHASASAQDPLGMRARHLGVEVDHLGLDPEAELHAEAADVVDEGVEPAGPDSRIDGPVTEAGAVVPSTQEPPVVEDEALHADGSGHIRKCGEPVEGVVEVDRLPGVGHDRLLASSAWRPRPQVRVQAVAHRVEPVVGPGPEQPGGAVGLATRQGHLAGGEQLAPADQAVPLGGALGVRRVVTAPGGVDGPDLAVGEAEARRSGNQEERGVVAGATPSAVAAVGALDPRVSLGRPLLAPSPGQVEQLGRLVADGQRVAHCSQVELAVESVGHRCPHPEQSCRAQLEVHLHCPARLGVGGGQTHRRVLVLIVLDTWGPPRQSRARGRSGPAGPVALQCGRAREASGALRDEPGGERPVVRGVRNPRTASGHEPVHRFTVEGAERGAPMEQNGYVVAVGRDEEAHSRPAEVDRTPGRGGGHGHSSPARA